jgi:hypothetical protein
MMAPPFQSLREENMRAVLMAIVLLAASHVTAGAQYLGNYTANPYVGPPAMPQPPGMFTNPYGNSYNSPKLYDSQGR